MEPILDPRLGDFEDDACSTKRRSLASLAGNMLAEISLPKLALAWALMLVVPSLLLGLAPIAASAWLHTVGWKIDFAISELWPVVLLMAVLALGWFGGRALFGLANASFWSLNSLAVEPVYLIVREVLRYVAEIRLPERASDSRYAAQRAAAAAVAGASMCAIAMFVLWLAWPSSRWTGTLADLTSLHRLAPVAFANSTVIVSAYVAAAALVWGISDALMDQPCTFDGSPSTPAGEHRTWRIAHLSDLHVVGECYGFRIESGRSGPRGNERFKQVLAQLAESHLREPVDAILVTGDMTDAGRSAEWAEFLDALALHPELAQRVLMLPGNHDLCIADRANPARLELPTSPNRRLRQLRVLSVMSAVQGRRVHVIDFEKRQLGTCLAEALQPYLADATKFADTGKPIVSPALARLWRNAYPLIAPPETDDGLGVILLNTNIESQFSFTSALGTVSSEQVRGLEIAAAQFPRACWIVALHHHVVEYPRAGQALADRIGTALINGNWFVRRLRGLADRAVVMHGHRHIDWMGSCGRLRIVSAPSPIMNATDDCPSYFYIHSLAATADGRLHLLPSRRVSLGA